MSQAEVPFTSSFLEPPFALEAEDRRYRGHYSPQQPFGVVLIEDTKAVFDLGLGIRDHASDDDEDEAYSPRFFVQAVCRAVDCLLFPAGVRLNFFNLSFDLGASQFQFGSRYLFSVVLESFGKQVTAGISKLINVVSLVFEDARFAAGWIKINPP